MLYQLDFEKQLRYDICQPGITLEVNITRGSSSVVLDVKVDTGASGCVFERSVGERLGLDIETGMRQPFGTATGTFVCYGHEVGLSVAGFQFDAMVFFASDLGIRRNVLGRFGWLDRVVLGLVDYEGKLFLSKYSSGT